MCRTDVCDSGKNTACSGAYKKGVPFAARPKTVNIDNLLLFFRHSGLLSLGLHGGELEALALITLHNSTKPFISLSIKTLSPRNSTQPYIGYVSIGLSRGLTA